MNIKKSFTSPESASSLMILGGILSLLGALLVAVIIWQRWDEIGVHLGPSSLPVVIIGSIGTVLLAVASGIWGLYKINSLTGPSSVKCIVACLLNALALAVLMAFVIVAYFLNVVA